jgi:hypothetical protein
METKHLRVILFAVALLSSTQALALTWKLKVLFPGQEEKNFILPEGDFQVKLPQSNYQCGVLKTDHTGDMERKDILCTKGNDSILTTRVCVTKGDGRLFNSAAGGKLEIGEIIKGKHLLTVLVLRCE